MADHTEASVTDKLKVIELFAGVGGFALGLESVLAPSTRFAAPLGPDESASGWQWKLGAGDWEVVWASQWEPSTRAQHAADVYASRLGVPRASAGQGGPKVLVDADIEVVLAADARLQAGDEEGARRLFVDHALDRHVRRSGSATDRSVKAEAIADGWLKAPLPARGEVDLIVGGFPCQDYSVAKPLAKAAGLHGQKGVLWWSIHSVLESRRPRQVLLENVDRLLSSPAAARGRDFAIMLSTLASLGYDVEWRVIDASEYGFPQRRRRVFIYAEHRCTSAPLSVEALEDRLESGVFGTVFEASFAGVARGEDLPVEHDPTRLNDVLYELPWKPFRTSPWGNAGVMSGGVTVVGRAVAASSTADSRVAADDWASHLKDVLLPGADFANDALSGFSIPRDQLDFDADPASEGTWNYAKGRKSKGRWSEGAIAFPDHLDRASRTIITGEGGRGLSRFKHVVIQGISHAPGDGGGWGKLADAVYACDDTCAHGPSDATHHFYRRLTPVELERLNMFPDGWTDVIESPSRRAFTMGNALVVGIVSELGRELASPQRRRGMTTPCGCEH